MEIVKQAIDLFLHLDDYMGVIINQFGALTYVIIFLIIFAETGLVVTPFLPGDSLLFVAGTLAGAGHMNIIVTYLALLLGAILGDTANYWIGHKIGPKVFSNNNSKIFKKEYLIKTTEFYEKHGGKTIILARFFPIIRTFAPFVAGVGKMHYDTFIKYNIVGGFLWVTLFTFAGYFFGGLPIIQKNFHYAVVGIIVVSLFPMIYEFMNHKRNAKKTDGKKADYKDIEETLKKAHLND